MTALSQEIFRVHNQSPCEYKHTRGQSRIIFVGLGMWADILDVAEVGTSGRLQIFAQDVDILHSR